jgi:hypothetical protein
VMMFVVIMMIIMYIFAIHCNIFLLFVF